LKNIFHKTLLGSVLILALSAGAAYSAVTNTNVYLPANYTTFVPPAMGGSYTDANFGTSIKRMSSTTVQRHPETGALLSWISHEYSSMTPFNNDNTRVLGLHVSYFALYDGSGNFVKDCPLQIHAASEPRWSRTDPNILYFINGNQLKQYNAANDAISVVHTFSEYSSVSGKGESDICFDGNHFVLVGDNRYVFVFEVSTRLKGGVFDTAGRGFDSVYITPNDNVTVTWYQAGTARYTGIELFDRNMNFLRQVSRAGGHMDVGRDVNGDEVLLLTNSADPTPVADNAIVKIRLSDGHQTPLISLDWSLAVHVSAPDNNGWVFVETYAPSDPTPGTAGWVKCTNELLQIKLDGTETRRLAHHRSRPFNSYNYGPRLSASRDGSKLVFSSNYGLQSLLGYTAEYSDVYMISLASGTPSTVTLAAAPVTASAGSSVTATWANVPSPAANNWIGLYPSSGTADNGYISWRYTNGLASSNLPFAIPAGAATGSTYVLRLYGNGGRLATSNTFAVQAATPQATTLTVGSTTVAAGASVTATWANISTPMANNWIGLYASSGAADNAYLSYRYTNGQADGSVPFAIPAGAAPGTTYVLRLYGSGGRLATSGSFTIQATTLSVASTTVNAGGSVTVTWANIANPAAINWIGLYPASGAADNAYISWRYTNGLASGSVSFTIPAGTAAGSGYVLRLYGNTGRLATSNSFTIQ
jgi:hypothetical protein